MDKLMVLRQRIERWKQIYMMNSDKDQVNKDLTIIENCIDSLEKQKMASLAPGMGYPVMKILNEIWHKYKTNKKITI